MRALLIMGVLAGCASEPEPSFITVHTGRPFVAAIDRGSGWEVLPDQESLVLEVDGPFLLTSVCGTIEELFVLAWAATAADDDEWTMPCRTAPGAYHDVTLRAPPGSVGYLDASFGNRWGGLIDDQPWRQDLLAGTTDVIAIERTGERRFVLLRDVVVDGPTELVVDVERDGRPLARHPVVHDMTAAAISIDTTIETDGVWVPSLSLFGESEEAWVLPPDVLREGDRQWITVTHDVDDYQQRRIGGVVGDDAFPAKLPDPLASATVSLDGVLPTATWEDDRHWSTYMLHTTQSREAPTQRRFWTFRVTPAWMDAAGVDARLDFPEVTSIPGWVSGWEIRPAERHQVSLGLTGPGEYGLTAGLTWREWSTP